MTDKLYTELVAKARELQQQYGRKRVMLLVFLLDPNDHIVSIGSSSPEGPPRNFTPAGRRRHDAWADAIRRLEVPPGKSVGALTETLTAVGISLRPGGRVASAFRSRFDSGLTWEHGVWTVYCTNGVGDLVSRFAGSRRYKAETFSLISNP